MATIDEIEQYPDEKEILKRYHHFKYLTTGKKQLSYYHQNKEKIRERYKKYYQEHKEEIKARVKGNAKKPYNDPSVNRERYYKNRLKEAIKEGESYGVKRQRGAMTPKKAASLYRELAIARAGLFTYENSGCGRKKKILCIMGRTGSGKTLASLHLRYKCGANVVCSFTNRIPRETEVEGRDHHFITKFYAPKDEVIARTRIGGNRYFALKSQIHGDCTVFVIDEKGFFDLVENHADEYILVPVLIKRNHHYILSSGVDMRLYRADKKRELQHFMFNTVIENNSTKRHLFEEIEKIYKEVCEL